MHKSLLLCKKSTKTLGGFKKEVTKGQQIMLTCETPEAVIYYTLDGSCPCNDTPSRQTYNGPITITDNVTVIKAMAAAKDLGESDVATFTYHLHGYSGEDMSSSVNIWPLVTRSNVNVDLGDLKAKRVFRHERRRCVYLQCHQCE